MRDHLVLYINGHRHAVGGRDALVSLSGYLRRRCGLIGTKIVCSEGDCGACTVLVGRPAREMNPPAPSPRWGGMGRGDAAGTNAQSHGDNTAPSPQPPASLRYLPIDSCIQFLFQLDGTHVVTVEGLGPPGRLNPVQQAMIDCHGSQCGFCTPGFVMTMTGLLEETDELSEADLRTGLTGNLCRCTGYTQIIESGLRCNDADHQRLNERYPPEAMLADFHELKKSPITLHSHPPSEPRGLPARSSEPRGSSPRSVTSHIAHSPTTLNDALAFLAEHPTATIVAGATDVGVRINKCGILPAAILDLNRVEELAHCRIENNTLIAGARATWTDILNSPPLKGGARGGITNSEEPTTKNGFAEAQTPSPNLSPQGRGIEEFARILEIFGAPQIRHVGTIAGNIANASPIADSLPFLFVMEARLVLARSDLARSASAERGATRNIPLPRREGLGEGLIAREVDINTFYKGYKQLDLQPGELITEIRIPLPTDADLLRLYKVSRRRDLDISTVTAALRLRLSDESEAISHAAIALGAVGPTIIRPRRAEQFLVGQPFTEPTMQAAADLAIEEITPLTDVRGAADYRRQLVRNIFRKFYHQYHAGLAPA